ncbi:pyrroloquinoline quinone biosynthesis protein PqqD [Salipiger pallidus]|uniref:Pyrroloquinoline quinone biosynthesis protein PqqD n=2 Tax=Salipiger pallidus TaxID=1775170 RepID=A0A8J2ZM95_9RHOB|nr:pyrroloquinoline quinone biosynthesis protein PqqD [Salipiger pallidus]
MDPHAIPVLPRGVRLHHDRVRGTWVLLAPERAVTLDQTAHAILSEVDGTRSLSQITATLAARYNAPEAEIAKDAAGFLGALCDRRFLDLAQEDAPPPAR